MSNKQIDEALNKILKNMNLELRDLTEKAQVGMREAMRQVMSKSYIQGSNDAIKIFTESFNESANVK